MSPRQIPDDIAKRRDAWFRYWKIWRSWHYLIGLAGVLCSAFVSTFSRSSYQTIVQWVSFVATLCAVLMTFLSPAKRGSGYVNAWRLLSLECIRYQEDPGWPVDKLIDAVKRGEEIIAKSE